MRRVCGVVTDAGAPCRNTVPVGWETCATHARDRVSPTCAWDGCDREKRRRRRFCITHENEDRKIRKKFVLCAVAGCKNQQQLRNKICATHARRVKLWGDPLKRMCRSCREPVKLDEDIVGGPFLCLKCLGEARICAVEGCGWKASKNSHLCNRHYVPKGFSRCSNCKEIGHTKRSCKKTSSLTTAKPT